MKAVCSPTQCTGCRACEAKCPKHAINLIDALDSVYAEINEDLCVHCGLCEKVCIVHNIAVKQLPIQWYQGWATNPEIRSSSSSGGIAAALTKKFIETGGYVCSCYFGDGEFSFHTTNNQEEAKRFAGSKYVKSNPSTAYSSVDKLLKNGERVLFIGLPCQVAGLKKYIPEHAQKNLYCIDLICHGTPSSGLFRLFLSQHTMMMENIDNISFRTGGRMGLNVKSIALEGTTDRYMISFLNGLNYTEGCYNCSYACTPRVSDVTLGDNWGTDLSEELPKGLSLVLCMTDKGEKMLADADINLLEVNVNKAISANGQLVHPSIKPEQRERFFREIKSGVNYDKLILRLFPKQSIKQLIKGVGIKMNLFKW